MPELVTADGRFVVERTSAQTTRAEMRNATATSGTQWSTLKLHFAGDCRDVLLKGHVPKIYGGTWFADNVGRIRGIVSQEGTEVETTMTSIVYLELAEDAEDPLVTYVFRLDGAGYELRGVLDSLPGGLEATPPGNPLLLRCRFLYSPTTKQLTITPTVPSPPIRVPEAVIPNLIRRLNLDAGDGPDGPYTLMMHGTGVIQGHAYLQSEQPETVMVVPDVITFDCGTALHRLWLNRGLFRWYVEEDLVVTIP